jgi:GMP synthase-like glutamine amidotransferase
MRILVIDNFPGTSLGLVGEALDEAGAEIDLRIMYRGDSLPADPSHHDGLVVLGGGQNAVADDDHPYLPRIAALSHTFGAADKAVLGICLGSQLVARGHGAENIIGRPTEFGWNKVRPTAAGTADPLVAALGTGAPVFHWHNDTFTLPPGAVHLASSGQTENQAFRVGRAVYGIQFHFEAGTELVREWTDGYAQTIARVQPDWFERYTREEARHGAKADRVGRAIARAWVALV